MNLLLFGAQRPFWALLLLAALTAFSALGIQKLQIDTDLGKLVALDDPGRLVHERAVATFGREDRSLIYLRDADLWTPEKLARVRALGQKIAASAAIDKVEDLYSQGGLLLQDGVLDASPILSAPPTSQAEADKARQRALANPLLIGNLLSEDGQGWVMLASLNPASEPAADHDPGRATGNGVGRPAWQAANRDINAAIDAFRADFDTLIYIGPDRVSDTLSEQMGRDMRRLGPLSAGLLLLILLLSLRSLSAGLLPLLTSLLSLLVGFGLMGWLGIPLNLLSAMLPTLIVVIGSTEDTHMIATYLFEQARNVGGQSKRSRRQAATRSMMRHMGVPLLLTMGTTALGFLSNAGSQVELIRDFAWGASITILANGLITLLLIPAMLSLIGPLRQRARAPGRRLATASVSLLRQSAWLILLLTALGLAWSLTQIGQVKTSNDPLSFLRESHPLIQDVRTLHRDIAGTRLFYVTLEAPRDGAFLEPENLRRIEAVQAFLDSQGAFDLSLSLVDKLALVNRQLHGGVEAYFRLPNTREQVAQLMLFFQRDQLEDVISSDHRRANILVRHTLSDSSVLNPFIAELRASLPRIVGAEIEAHVVGEHLMINAAAERLIDAQIVSVLMLLGVIVLIMSVMFTSIKGGLVALVPSGLPVLGLFGVMGYFGIPLNPGTAMVAVIAIGVGLDNTIHLLSRYNSLCRSVSDYDQAVIDTLNEEARPILSAGLALIAGFLVLLDSEFIVIAQFGALSAVTIGLSVLANLVITPLIMTRVRLIGLHQILGLKLVTACAEQSPLFRDMSNYQVRKAVLISRNEWFQPGERIIVQGSCSRSMYLILSGETEVRLNLDSDTVESTRHLATLGPGAVFGEIGYIGECQRTADVIATTPVEVLRFDYQRMQKDLKFFPHIVAKLNFNISRILGERLANQLQQ